jgi:hypothetical protein
LALEADFIFLRGQPKRRNVVNPIMFSKTTPSLPEKGGKLLSPIGGLLAPSPYYLEGERLLIYHMKPASVHEIHRPKKTPATLFLPIICLPWQSPKIAKRGILTRNRGLQPT